MKKLFLILFASILTLGLNAQNRVTSVASDDIVQLLAPSGLNKKTITVGNFLNGIEIGGGTPAAGSFTTLLLGNGTVAAPSLSFTSDADNGIYRIGSNNIGFSTGGSKILDIATTGLGVTGTLTSTGLLSPAAAINNSAGTVGAPAYSFTGQTNMGLYKISSTQLGSAVSGALVGGWNASGLFTGYITEQISGSGIAFSKQTIQLRTATTYTATGAITVTAAELNKGLLVAATATATTTFTLPTATDAGTQLGADAGTTFDFVVSNASAGDNGTVTVAVGAGITASDFPGSNTLTRTGSTTVGIAVFRLTFISATAAILTRIS